MGKAARGGGSADAHVANNPIFNKELGQHILKNPLVAQGIVDKVRWASSVGGASQRIILHPV